MLFLCSPPCSLTSLLTCDARQPLGITSGFPLTCALKVDMSAVCPWDVCYFPTHSNPIKYKWSLILSYAADDVSDSWSTLRAAGCLLCVSVKTSTRDTRKLLLWIFGTMGVACHRRSVSEWLLRVVGVVARRPENINMLSFSQIIRLLLPPISVVMRSPQLITAIIINEYPHQASQQHPLLALPQHN